MTRHTRTTPGRFNAGTAAHPAAEALYLAADILVAQFEVGLLLGPPTGGFVPNPLAVGWSFLPVVVNLQRIVDLTAPSELGHLDTSVQELTGDWRGYGFRTPAVPQLAPPHWTNVPTQQLAAMLVQTKLYEGLLTFSAKDTTKKNLVVFPARLRKASSVKYTDPITGRTTSIP